MREVLAMADRVATADSTVLLQGETGVGKERLATFIHAHSARQRAPFIAVNCGALTETLLESELFGHRRGAFTGAVADHAGVFEAAHGGTLLLDEIGEMPLMMQAALLRVLQEREVRRVGDHQSRSVDVRVLAATNRDLDAEVDAHHFRRDLFYRLNVVVLRIPPLRERLDDLKALLHSVLDTTACRLHRSVTGYTARAYRRLLDYGWPGNIRELQNAIEHACLMTPGPDIDRDHLPEAVRSGNGIGVSSGHIIRPLEEIEREHILAALAALGGNRRLAAKHLRIGIATLHRRLRRYSQPDAVSK